MGIFSLFGKKDRQPAKPADKDASRSKSTATKPRPDAGKSNTKTPTVRRDAQTALQTALKIDAIESEMSSEFVSVQTATGSKAKPVSIKPAATPQLAAATPKPSPENPDSAALTTENLTLQPLATGIGSTTEFLLDGQTAVSDIASPSSEAVAVIEEAAIMFANGQSDMVEHMLHAAIAAGDLGEVEKTAWLMLLDLYQIVGKQQEFDNLAIEYTNKFETSPPAWHGADARTATSATPAAGTTPMVPFNTKLDASCAKQIERIQKLAENFRALRLEFVRVTEVDAAGCRLLLGILRKLQKSSHDLILVGAPELTDKIRAILEVGRRDDTEDAWLLLLEVLRLLNREKEFEEISIDYCVTFEVSPLLSLRRKTRSPRQRPSRRTPRRQKAS
ncbi:STAS domain-containing protein [Noviherbaspirillum saxi]|uniref:STAS domain-containing protein n=1 Tax=Noviherbaspirillum saxi TaxID=2320863 RepID=UPI001F3FA6AC|nr:STAS domain-containing protein [Noviherbaspirillum saxi]